MKKLGNILITKELFIKIISDIENQYKHDDKCQNAFTIILPHDYISGYDYHFIIDRLMNLLKTAFNDNHKESWIEYFIFELDFGKNYECGCITDNGEDVDISDSGKLYDFLINQK